MTHLTPIVKEAQLDALACLRVRRMLYQCVATDSTRQVYIHAVRVERIRCPADTVACRVTHGTARNAVAVGVAISMAVGPVWSRSSRRRRRRVRGIVVAVAAAPHATHPVTALAVTCTHRHTQRHTETQRHSSGDNVTAGDAGVQ